MNVLVIGGTRLLGLALVKQLLAADHKVTVLTHHPEKCTAGVECIGAEREKGLTNLGGRRFDVTMDFIAYDEKAPTQVFNSIYPGTYILISSTWLLRLDPSIAADQEISIVDDACAKLIPAVTYSYLIGKMRAEATVLEMRKRNGTATILRLPIFWGYKEHTGRFDFYRQRISDGAPIICVDGGNNYAQIVWTEDIARIAACWLGKASERSIWEGIPDNGDKVRDIIKQIAICAGKQPKLVDVSSKQLLVELPDFLTEEPLWRESMINITESNLFHIMNTKPTPQSKWLCDLAKHEISFTISELRKKEITFLDGNINAS